MWRPDSGLAWVGLISVQSNPSFSWKKPHYRNRTNFAYFCLIPVELALLSLNGPYVPGIRHIALILV